MCGRFTQISPLTKIKKFFDIDNITCEVTPNYNVAPTQQVLIIVLREGRQLDKYNWGLVPPWEK